MKNKKRVEDRDSLNYHAKQIIKKLTSRKEILNDIGCVDWVEDELLMIKIVETYLSKNLIKNKNMATLLTSYYEEKDGMQSRISVEDYDNLEDKSEICVLSEGYHPLWHGEIDLTKSYKYVRITEIKK